MSIDVAAEVPGHRSPLDRVRVGEGPLFRLGAILGVLGVILVVIMEVFLHPSDAQPNDSVAAFREYAAYGSFTSVHIGDFIGTLFMVLALIILYRSLSRQTGLAGAFALVGVVAAVLTVAIFAVQMAVDGVALKSTVDAWVGAPPAQRTSAFQVADAVRDIEKGLSGFFQMTNGIALLGLGLSMALGTFYARWLGLVGALAGVGFLILGWITAHTGFSHKGHAFGLPTIILLAVFVLGCCTVMWRASRSARSPTL